MRTLHIGCILAALALGTACSEKTKRGHPEKRDLTEAVYASGNLFPQNEYRLYANADGTILNSYVEAGDPVQVGMLLFMIDRQTDMSRLNAVTSALEVAQGNAGEGSPLLKEQQALLNTAYQKFQLDSSNYHRYKTLLEKQAVSLKIFEQSKLAYEASLNEYKARQQVYRRTRDQLRVEADNARSNYDMVLKSYSEHAPVSRINGLVYEVLKEEGESVRRGELLAILGSSDSMLIRMEVDELDIRQVKVGQEVLIRFDVDQQRVYRARVKRIFPKLNINDQSFRVEAVFTEEGPKGYYGLTLEANIVVRKREQVLCIPRDLLLAGDSVMVMHDGEPLKQKVETGAVDWDFVEITGGIDSTSELILH